MNKVFVFDVESIGLYGEGYAVGGGIYHADGTRESEFAFSCPPENALGDADDRDWVSKNIPPLVITHLRPYEVREAFWSQWLAAKEQGIPMAAECGYPVETNFLAACVHNDKRSNKWNGPYPFIEISSVMIAAGMDPMITYERVGDENPKHHPLADARQSARLLFEALSKVTLK
jgi:hypothetical protein